MVAWVAAAGRICLIFVSPHGAGSVLPRDDRHDEGGVDVGGSTHLHAAFVAAVPHHD